MIFCLFCSVSYAETVKIGWDASISAGVSGYKLYCGTVSGTYNNIMDAKANLIQEVPNLENTKSYYFVATAYDSTGLESDYSEELLIHPILVNQKTGGVIDISTQFVENGENKTFNITVTKGYQLMDILINGVSIGPKNSYTLTNITKPMSIVPVYVQKPVCPGKPHIKR